MEMHANPMCLKTRNTLIVLPPATNMANGSNRFPAGILLPLIVVWLFYVLSFFLQLGLAHDVVISAIVLHFLASTKGLSSLQEGQN